MFEAILERASVLKRIIDSISSLVQEVNFDCTPNGITLQALDSAHVSLVSLLLRYDGFQFYRCDRSMTLGINLDSLTKILKCSSNDDMLTMRAADDDDHITFLFEYKNKVSEFELKLMEIDLDKLSIPDSTYTATIQMPSHEFQRTISSLQSLGDSVTISVMADTVKFSVSGDCKGSITLNQNSEIDNDSATIINLQDPITLTFAMRYLHSFTKATSLSPWVLLSLSLDVPLVLEYQIEDNISSTASNSKERAYDDEAPVKKVKRESGTMRKRGHIRYYLAPKIDDEN